MLELTKKELNSLVCNSNNVIIKPDFLHTKNVELAGGIKMMLYTDFEREKFAATTGEVITLCDDLYFSKTGGNGISNKYDTAIEIQVGDKVYFHYNDMEKCRSQGRIFKCENEYYIIHRYGSLFCMKRGDTTTMLNGWILMEPYVDDKYKDSKILVPDSVRGKASSLISRVAFVGKPCLGYYEDKSMIDDHVDVSVGDLVIFDKNSDIPLQYSMLSNLEGKKTFYRMQRKDLKATVDLHIFEN